MGQILQVTLFRVLAEFSMLTSPILSSKQVWISILSGLIYMSKIRVCVAQQIVNFLFSLRIFFFSFSFERKCRFSARVQV